MGDRREAEQRRAELIQRRLALLVAQSAPRRAVGGPPRGGLVGEEPDRGDGSEPVRVEQSWVAADEGPVTAPAAAVRVSVADAGPPGLQDTSAVAPSRDGPRSETTSAPGVAAMGSGASGTAASTASGATSAPGAAAMHAASSDVEPVTGALGVGQSRVIAAARELGARHARALALMAVGVVLVSVWGLLRARTVPLETPAIAAASPSVIAPTPSASPTPVRWAVHVQGAVASPGVVYVPAQSRVVDVIAAAGGLTPQADPGDLNLAAQVPDGAQVIIGTAAQPRGEVRSGQPSTAGSGTGAGTAGATDPAGGLIDLNTATLAQLDGLPGVGPVTAQAILTWRTQHGRFTSVGELQEVDGIGPKTFAQLEPHVRV